MNKQLNKAVDLLEAIQLDLLNNEISINAVLVEQLGEFIDDYYAEISFLNENFSKAINNELEGYIQAILASMDFSKLSSEITIQNKNTSRTYRARYKREGEELIIIQPFKEI